MQTLLSLRLLPPRPAEPETEPQPEPAQVPEPPVAEIAAESEAEAEASSAVSSDIGGRFFSPLVRSLAGKHGLSELELASIPGSGKNGRVTKDDVMLYLKHRGAGAPVAAAQPAAKGYVPPDLPKPAYGKDGTKAEPFDNMRKLIAEHMVRSKATSPHVYSMSEVGRNQHRQVEEEASGGICRPRRLQAELYAVLPRSNR